MWYLARNPFNLDPQSNEPVSRALPFQTRDDDVPNGMACQLVARSNASNAHAHALQGLRMGMVCSRAYALG